VQQKKVYKVVSPIERKDGSTWWMRCGSAHTNKDESINLYVDALPLASMTPGKGITLQIRELSEQEMREREERRSAFASRPAFGPNGLPLAVPPRPDGSADSVPF
jgi:hypothetical protein